MSTNSGRDGTPDEVEPDDLVAQLQVLLTPSGSASRSTESAPALNAFVRRQLGLDPSAGPSPAAWRLVELAVEKTEPKVPHTERPLEAARYLLALGELPRETNQSIYVSFPERFQRETPNKQPVRVTDHYAVLADLFRYASLSAGAQVDLEQKIGQRQVLAGTTSANSSRSAWYDGKQTKRAAQALQTKMFELVSDQDVLDELRRAEAVVATQPASEHGKSDLDAPDTSIAGSGWASAIEASAPSPVALPATNRRRSTRRALLLGAGAGAVGLAALGGVLASRSPGAGSDPEAPIEVRQRLEIAGLGPMVLATAVQVGAPAPANGCAALHSIPQTWDPITDHYEVMFHITPLRDDVTLTGFELTSSTHSELGPRVQLTCDAGGNGAHSGFNVADTKDGVTVTPTGAGLVNDRMQLYLNPDNGTYRIAAWFSGEVARITDWEGQFVFNYGIDGEKRFYLATGRVRTAAAPAGISVLGAKNGRWQPAQL